MVIGGDNIAMCESPQESIAIEKDALEDIAPSTFLNECEDVN